MGKRAALFALMFAGACGGGGATKPPVATTPDEPVATPKPPPPPPSKPLPKPVDLATLEVWEGNVDGGPVVVTAADVDSEVLRRVVVPAAIEIISVRNDALVTGRVAGSRVGVLSALTGVNPALKLGPRAKLAGKGPPLAIDEVGIELHALGPRFADAMKTNVVVVAPPRQLTVSATAPSAQKLLDEVAKAAGLVTEKPAANVIVMRAKAWPKIGKLPAKGAKIDLDVRGARPGDVLGLIAGVTGAAAPTGTCTPGEPTTLRLKAVPSGAAAKLVEKMGGELRVSACTLAAEPDADLSQLTLVASATSGGETLWLAMDGDRAVVTDSKDAGWPVGTGGAGSTAGDDPLAEARLAATITGVGAGVAIVEVDGRFRVLQPVEVSAGGQPGLVSVGLGEIEVADAGGAKRTLKLSTRP